MAHLPIEDRFLDALGANDALKHTIRLSPRGASYGELDARICPVVTDWLGKEGIDRLFSHQAEAVRAALDGEDLIVTTGTNSGKSLCYTIPILQSCALEPSCRALMVFPTKALAQDQTLKLSKSVPSSIARIATYDGDTPKSQRSAIRSLAHLVATNPDMLHVGILPGHENWARMLKSLRFIVLDEAHVYRGVFGIHVAWILRRLLRLCQSYGSRPQIVACSATLRDAGAHLHALTGRSFTTIEMDGSPRGKRTFAFLSHPLDEDGRETSRNYFCASTMVRLAESGLRSLTFNRSRIGAELVLKYARELATQSTVIDPLSIESYRAGYTPAERREIERQLFSGKTMALSSTNALELGVDIGGLDAVVMNGFPGTASSFWQQAGRAGRGSTDGAVAFVAGDDPLDHYLAENPDLLFEASTEPATLAISNRLVAESQLKCMAFEKPIGASELGEFHPIGLESAERLADSGEFDVQGGRFYYPHHDSPAPSIDIRGAGGRMVELRHKNLALGSMEFWRALQYAHTGAIYLHRGETYRVIELDCSNGKADLEMLAVDYFTRPIVQSVVEHLGIWRSKNSGPIGIDHCSVRVTTSILGYRRHSVADGKAIETLELRLPHEEMETVGVRWTLPSFADDDPPRHMSAVHTVEHALIATAPVFAGCDRGDLGSSWYPSANGVEEAQIFVFDAIAGGIGLSEGLWERSEPHWLASKELLANCRCSIGCPRCILLSRCEIGNESLDKSAARQLLEAP